MDGGKDDDKGPKVQYEICHEYMLKRSLQRHMQRRHPMSSSGRRSPSLESASTTATNEQLLRIPRTGATLRRELERVYDDAAEAMLRAGGRHTRRQLEHFVAATFPGIPAEFRQPLISGVLVGARYCARLHFAYVTNTNDPENKGSATAAGAQRTLSYWVAGEELSTWEPAMSTSEAIQIELLPEPVEFQSPLPARGRSLVEGQTAVVGVPPTKPSATSQERYEAEVETTSEAEIADTPPTAQRPLSTPVRKKAEAPTEPVPTAKVQPEVVTAPAVSMSLDQLVQRDIKEQPALEIDLDHQSESEDQLFTQLPATTGKRRVSPQSKARDSPYHSAPRSEERDDKSGRKRRSRQRSTSSEESRSPSVWRRSPSPRRRAHHRHRESSPKRSPRRQGREPSSGGDDRRRRLHWPPHRR